MSKQRWFFANVLVFGDIAFRADDLSGESVQARNLTRVVTKHDGHHFHTSIMQHPGYAAGLYADPMTIHRAAIVAACVAPRDLAEKCDGLWGNVQIASASVLNRLNGGRPK